MKKRGGDWEKGRMGEETFRVTPWLKKKKIIELQFNNQLDKSIKIFSSSYELAETFALELTAMINESAKKKRSFSVALSGGSTPEILFSLFGDRFSKSVRWDYTHFFWGDERCVPPDDPESNFGNAKKNFFEKTDIPLTNIHRIKGESDPEEEAVRYSQEIASNTLQRGGLPKFDMIILGLGEDGHTASIFPENMVLLNSNKICEVAIHPVTHQKRLTLTGRVINNSDFVTFLVTGKKKAEIVEKIIRKGASALDFPASFIDPAFGLLSWFLDKEAAGLL